MQIQFPDHTGRVVSSSFCRTNSKPPAPLSSGSKSHSAQDDLFHSLTNSFRSFGRLTRLEGRFWKLRPDDARLGECRHRSRAGPLYGSPTTQERFETMPTGSSVSGIGTSASEPDPLRIWRLRDLNAQGGVR